MSRARKYMKRQVSTWTDKDFRALTLEEQGFYDALCSYPDLSRCGVIQWIPSRLAQCSDGLTDKKVSKLTDTLVIRNFLRADYDAAELLIRSHIRHDGGLATPNISHAIATAYRKILSPYIADSALAELARLFGEDPDLAGWERIKKEDPELYEEVIWHPLAKGVS